MNTDINKCLSKLGSGNLAKDLADAQSGGFTGVVKFGILVICVFVIITTVVNFIAYLDLYNNPNDADNLSTGWCIAMLAINTLLGLSALTIIIMLIISFVRKGKGIDKLAADINLTQVNKVNEAYARIAEESVELGSRAAADIAATMVADIEYEKFIDNPPKDKSDPTKELSFKEIKVKADAKNKEVYAKIFDEAKDKFVIEYRKQLARATYTDGIIFPGVPDPTTALGSFISHKYRTCGSDPTKSPPCGDAQDYEANLYNDLYNLNNRVGAVGSQRALAVGASGAQVSAIAAIAAAQGMAVSPQNMAQPSGFTTLSGLVGTPVQPSVPPGAAVTGAAVPPGAAGTGAAGVRRTVQPVQITPALSAFRQNADNSLRTPALAPALAPALPQ